MLHRSIPCHSSPARRDSASSRCSFHEPRAAGIFRSAFSILELVLVIAIVGIVAAIAVPRYGNAASRYRVETAGRRLAEEIRLCADTARTQSATVKLYARAGGTRVLRRIDSGPNAGTDAILDLSVSPYEAKVTRIDLAASVVVSFNGSGLPDSPAVLLVRSGSQIIQLTLDSTGGVSIGTPISAPTPITGEIVATVTEVDDDPAVVSQGGQVGGLELAPGGRP